MRQSGSKSDLEPIRQSGPEYGPGFQVKVDPSSLGSGTQKEEGDLCPEVRCANMAHVRQTKPDDGRHSINVVSTLAGVLCLQTCVQKISPSCSTSTVALTRFENMNMAHIRQSKPNSGTYKTGKARFRPHVRQSKPDSGAYKTVKARLRQYLKRSKPDLCPEDLPKLLDFHRGVNASSSRKLRKLLI